MCFISILAFVGINVLCGVGILSTPYATKEGGWLGLSILFIFAILSFYTGILLRSCLDSAPGLETYPDIGQAAFGSAGRIVVSVSLIGNLLSFLSEFIFFNLRMKRGGGQILCKLTVFNLLFSLFFLWMQIILYVELYVSKAGSLSECSF